MTPSYDLESVIDQLERHEGKRNYLYNDKTGRRVRAADGKLTIGVGHNIDDNGLPDHVIRLLLLHDIHLAIKELNKRLPWWSKLDGIRQEALINMMFNMGWQPRGPGSGLSSFNRTLFYIRLGLFRRAAGNIRNSRYAKQTKSRAKEVAYQIETGKRYGEH